MTRVWLEGIGVALPGYCGWDAAAKALVAGDIATLEPEWSPDVSGLPSRQARRLSIATRAAICAAQQIEPLLPHDAAWVFASSLGEGETLHIILDALCDDPIMLQPTRFQNAVHNASSGHWTILKGFKGPVTSLAAFDDTAAAGFAKAILQCHQETIPTGMILFDAPIPEPLGEKRPLSCTVALSFAFTPKQTPNSIAQLLLEPFKGPATAPGSPLGTQLWNSGNPVGRAMPFLEALARSHEQVALNDTLSLRCEYV